MTIYFYSTVDEYGDFSNFSLHGFVIAGVYWKTVEHYFQAMKFEGTVYQQQVQEAYTAKQAAELGRRRDFPLRDDWDGIKDSVMLRGVRAKFQTHKDLRDLLLATGDQEIVENARGDYYWGCGADGSGLNKLGKILMQVRDELRGLRDE